MPVDDFDVPEWVHNLLAEIKLDDYIRAGTNVTIREINHLIRIAKDGRLDVETISKLYREANKFSGAGTVLTAGALVILVVFLCHPRVVSRPVLNALRLTAAGVATGMFLSVRLIPCIVEVHRCYEHDDIRDENRHELSTTRMTDDMMNTIC
ncbi:hypothetical protein D6C79_06910 [Aureobasidium pullulans]|nr:hypothetical protein D6C79_06910 [Aureobasidium pullulans]